jgi:hypothetical protein
MFKTTEEVISRMDDRIMDLMVTASNEVPIKNHDIKSMNPNWMLPLLFCYIANSFWPECTQAPMLSKYPAEPMQGYSMDTHKACVENYMKQLKQYGVDSKRIDEIMLRMETWGIHYALSSDLFQQIPIVDEWWPLSCNFDLLYAMTVLGAEEAVSLFETTELHEIARKINFVRYMNYRHTPLYSLGELADLLESFIKHTNENSEELLRCGYPYRGFTESSWLACQLDQLYFVQYPMITVAASDDSCNFTYVFASSISKKWRTIPKGAVKVRTNFGCDGHRYKDHIYLANGQTYQESSPNNFPCAMLEGPAENVMWLRGKVHKAKLRILRLLVSALRHKNVEGLWEKCLTVLVENLTDDNIKFLLASEMNYTGYDIKADKCGDHYRATKAGGLVDILLIIGHCEKEITFGTFSRTREHLDEIILENRLNSPRLKVRSYYEALRLGYDKVLNDAYDIFQSTNIDEKLFWNHFIDRLNSAVESEFRSDVVIHKKVKKKHVSKFEPKMEQFAKQLDNSLELSGEYPIITTSIAVSNSASQQAEYDYVFRQDGDMWTVKFNDVKKLVKDLDGMHYIKLLLESPGKKLRADDLYYQVHPIDTEQNIDEAAELSMDELLQQYQIHKDIASEIVDPEERERYMFLVEQLQTCKENQRDALMSNKMETVSRLREEHTLLHRMISSNFDKKGRPRVVSDPIKNQRQAIGKSIAKAVKNIKDVHPSLADHLDKITTGTDCSYGGGLDWQTDEIAHTIHRKEAPQNEWCA